MKTTLLFYHAILLVDYGFVPTTGFSLGGDGGGRPQHKVQICQNKDCCRQWTLTSTNLVETLQDLLPADDVMNVQIESTGCLSQCGKGPNIMMIFNDDDDDDKKKNREPVLLHAVGGPHQLAQELQHHFGVRIPSKLLAAVTVMDKARKATTFAEKDRYLSSVIQVLQNDPLLRTSNANMRAHVLRAQVRNDYGMIEEALYDISEALAVAPSEGGALVGRAWRTRADCCQALGRITDGEHALRQWAKCDPSCHAKAMKEIQILKSQSSSAP